MSCRMYEKVFPEVDEVVMVKVTQITSTGVEVELLAYNNIQGLIQLNELSRRRFHSIQQVVKLDQVSPAIVLTVDQHKGFIDLSKKLLTHSEKLKCENQYQESKTVHSILTRLALVGKVSLLSLYEQFAWDLAKRYQSIFASFVHLSKSQTPIEEVVLESYVLSPVLSSLLLKEVQRRFRHKSKHTVQSELEVTCFQSEGIDAIKFALKCGIEAGTLSNSNGLVRIQIRASPIYLVTVETLDPDLGIQILNHVHDSVKSAILEKGGNMEIKRIITNQVIDPSKDSSDEMEPEE